VVRRCDPLNGGGRRPQYLISGIAEIDIDDWMHHTTYKNCSENDKVIKWFWQVRTVLLQRCHRAAQRY